MTKRHFYDIIILIWDNFINKKNMKQKIKSLISLKTTGAFFGLLFFVALAGGAVINAPSASATVTVNTQPVADFTSGIYKADALFSVVKFGITQDAAETLSSVAVTVIGEATAVSGDFASLKVYKEDGTTVGFQSGEDTLVGTQATVNVGSITTISTGTTAIGATETTFYVVATIAASPTDTNAFSVDVATNGIVASTGALTTTALDGGATAIATIDTAAPTAAITYSDADGIVKSGDSLTITATFNEAMADSPVVQIALSGANTVTAVNMTKATTTSYTYIHTVVAGNGTVTVALSTGTDVAANVITSAPTSGTTFTVDNTAPTVAITSSESDPTSTSPFSVTITFSEAVTTFVVGDITVSNGAAGNFSATSALIYTADITPVANGTVTVDVAGSVAIDTAGNNNIAATQFSIVYDGTAPTATFSPAGGTTGVAVDTTITLTFSEAMRLLSNSAITDPAALITLKKTNSSGANVSFTATINAGKTIITITPSANLSYGQLHYVAIGASVEDAADNAITATSITFTTVNSGGGTVSPIPSSTTGQAAATPANGGIISKTNSDGTSAKVVLPVGALVANAVITISPTVKAETVLSMPLPSGKSIIGGYAYNFTAVNAVNTAVNAFEKALTLTFTYTDEQAGGMSEEALRVHYWDETLSQWVMLAGGKVDTASNIVTATTDHFTYFSVFEGDEVTILSSEIIDGDIIQCQNSDNPLAVYIVKIIGDTKYIRHIVSLEIFDYYGHLKWEDLKQVDSLDDYSLSGWARVNTEPNGTAGPNDKVYEINADQSKHWINMTAEDFLSHGGSEPAIYSINQGELDLYTTGADVMSL